MGFSEIQGTINSLKTYSKNGNVKEMAKFWDTYDLPKLSQEHISNLTNKQQGWSSNKKSPSKEKSQTEWISAYIY